ncbi:MAG TPA: glycosyltransferase [Oscillospiraceae bacterium]|nr:glycosyltransferase [Oscillospiraceae bacterium]HPS34306.1 glycosyltransferase [Oscillospiraceae bacterium]
MADTVFEFIGSLADGGAETLVKDYAKMLDPTLFCVKAVVIHADKSTANYKTIAANDTEIIAVYKKWNVAVRAFNKVFGKYFVSRKLKRFIKQYHPTCIHVHLALLKYLVPISKELKGIRLLYTCHSLPEHLFEGKNAAEKKAANYLIKNHALRLISINPEAKDQLNEIFHIDNTVFIRNGIDFSRFHNNGIKKEEVRKELGIPEDAFVIGHVGRFSPYKNHEFLIDIFNETKKINDQAFLVMVGTGETKKDIMAKVRRLRLEQSTIVLSARPDIHRILKAVDAFVYPAKFEGLRIVMIEAQVSGLHCVLSDSVAKEAFISPLAIPMSIHESPEKWAEAVIDITRRSAIEDRTSEYDMKKEIRRLEKLYMGLNSSP